MHTEQAVVFECEGELLIGVVASPVTVCGSMLKIGVIVVVGGPQYRVGSHRQFVLLARFLADNGVPCMRFDSRGMGDSTGEIRDFENVTPDIEAAIEAFVREVPGLDQVVLWGLCDGASAICFSLGRDSRVSGAVLLNPWVRSASTEARTMLKHYYLRRLVDKQFWLKLIRGGVSVRGAMGEVSAAVGLATRQANQPPSPKVQGTVPERMLKGLEASRVPVAIFLSGRDYVAREFEQCVAADRAWARFVNSELCDVRHFNEADHTFSSAELSGSVAAETLEWVRKIYGR